VGRLGPSNYATALTKNESPIKSHSFLSSWLSIYVPGLGENECRIRY